MNETLAAQAVQEVSAKSQFSPGGVAEAAWTVTRNQGVQALGKGQTLGVSPATVLSVQRLLQPANLKRSGLIPLRSMRSPYSGIR